MSNALPLPVDLTDVGVKMTYYTGRRVVPIDYCNAVLYGYHSVGTGRGRLRPQPTR